MVIVVADGRRPRVVSARAVSRLVGWDDEGVVMSKPAVTGGAILAAALLGSAASAATVVLYDQDFESPANYVNNRDDINIGTTVNQNYGGQPAGFEFAQAFTVETLNVTGSMRGDRGAAFGTGYSDPSGLGGDFALGIWDGQDDRLGLSFDVGSLDFLNLGLILSSIDLSSFQGPFLPPEGLVPTLQFTLYDNPGGATGLFGNGTVLSQDTLTGTASPQTVFEWTEGILAFSTDGNTDGNVTLQIDLIEGDYAAFDDLLITASDEAGDLGGGGVDGGVDGGGTGGVVTPAPIPLPAGLPLLAGAIAGLGLLRRRATR